MKTRRVLFRCLAGLASVGVALGVAEVVVRIVRPQFTPFSGRGIYRKDADLGHRLMPGRPTTGGPISSAGFRDREFSRKKPPTTFRAMAIGDSFTFGIVSLEDVYPKVLERRLCQTFPEQRTEVINAGVPCYNTLQEIRHLEKIGLKFHPDLVVLGFFVGNDIRENAEDPFLAVVDGELAGMGSGPSVLERWLAHSHLYRWIRRSTWSQASAHSIPGPLVASLAPPPLYRRDFLTTEAKALAACQRTGRISRRIEEGWQETESLLRELRDLAREKRFDLVVFLIPDAIQVDEALFKAVVESDGLVASDYDLDLPQRRLREFGAREGIEMVDALGACRERAARGEALYAPSDTHWNEAGNRLAAESLVEPIAAKIRARVRSG